MAERSIADHQFALQRATEAGDLVAAEKIRANLDAAIKLQASHMATEGMSGLDKVRANLGAGVDQAWQGFKQIMPGMKGASDEEVRDTRVRNRALADETDLGVGPDWAPTAGKTLQFLGETAPSMAIPGGAAASALRFLPRAGQAIAAGGIAGAGAGALQPVTSDESRTGNTIIGGLAGAALPVGIAAVRGTAGAIRGRAAEKLIDDLADDFMHTHPGVPRAEARRLAAQQAVADVNTYAPRGAENIPMSTASITQSPSLGMAERASRAADVPQWHPYDAAQNRAVWQNVERATAGADELGARRAARQTGWTQNEADAMANIKPRNWSRDQAAFADALEVASRSPAGQNEMRPVIAEIQRQMRELGPQGFTPQHMARLRSRMAGSIKGAGDDVFANAPKSDPYFMSLRQEMDDILNRATGNKWQKVPEGYAAQSAPVAEAQGLQGIREAFVSPQGVTKVGERGGVPHVTEGKLRTVLSNSGENRFGDVLSDEPRTVLNATLDALRRADFPHGQIKGSGARGGSDSVMNALNVARQHMSGGQGGKTAWGAVTALYDKALQRGSRAEAQQILLALQDPNAFVRMVEDSMRRRIPLPPSVMQAAQALGTRASAELTVDQFQPGGQ